MKTYTVTLNGENQGTIYSESPVDAIRSTMLIKGMPYAQSAKAIADGETDSDMYLGCRPDDTERFVWERKISPLETGQKLTESTQLVNTVWIGWYHSGNIFYSDEQGHDHGMAYWDELLKAANAGKKIVDYETEKELTIADIEHFINRDSRYQGKQEKD